MDQIYLFAGLYGFFGSIHIILFKIWPDVIDWRAKKRTISRGISPADWEDVYNDWKFFPNPDDETYLESQKTYGFYSTLWSFRLIATGFMITIIYSIWPSEFLGSTYNSLFVFLDIFFLLIVSLFGIDGVRYRNINASHPILLFVIFSFNLGFYALMGVLNFVNTESIGVFIIDNILIVSTAISQIIFTSLFFSRYFINKNKNF